MAVQFFFLDTKITLSNRSELKRFISKIFKEEKTELESLSYIFCSDDFILDINRKYLKHNYFTDIITFDFSEKNKTIGEVYISVDTIRDNANKFGTTIKEELHRVIFHGALHLCGFQDKTPLKKKEMTKAEDKYLGIYFN